MRESSHFEVVGLFVNAHYRLQELSFALCHNYAKATRSVSIPAPVYCTFSSLLDLSTKLIDLWAQMPM